MLQVFDSWRTMVIIAKTAYTIEFQGGTKVSAFVSKTPTRIVVQVPMNAKTGALKLVTVKDYEVVTEAMVTFFL